jgi:hypothetical protein
MSYGQSSRNKSPGKMKSWSPSRSGGHIYGSHGKASANRDKRDVSQVRPTLYVSRSHWLAHFSLWLAHTCCDNVLLAMRLSLQMYCSFFLQKWRSYPKRFTRKSSSCSWLVQWCKPKWKSNAKREPKCILFNILKIFHCDRKNNSLLTNHDKTLVIFLITYSSLGYGCTYGHLDFTDQFTQ